MAKKLLAPKDEARLRRKVKRSPLAQMHALLRTHGWKPKLSSYSPVIDAWRWTLRGCDEIIITSRISPSHAARKSTPPKWYVVPRMGLPRQRQWAGSPSVADLEQKLKELAQKK